MADEIDIANEQAELTLAFALKARKKSPAPTGACHNCEAELVAPRLHFCDGDCARDYERRENARARNGV
jgi:hypothetical protein